MPALAFVGSAPAVPLTLDALFNGGGATSPGADYAIGAASSTDGGATWVEDAGNPVISKSGSGWCSAHVKDPWLMPDGLTAFVSGFDGTRYQIGRLTRATTSSAWVYDSTSTPAIPVGGSGAPDEHGCSFPVVFDEGSAGAKRYKVWYCGIDASGKATVCYAYSPNPDLSSLTKVGRVVDVGAGGSWNANGCLPGAVVKSGSTYYLFVAGRKNASSPVRWQGGTWSFTDPEGAYTAAAGNPTLTADFNTAGISLVLTANAASGQSVVHVSDTSHWVVGMPMIICSSTATAEYHRIASIDSGTQVTLDSHLVSSFTTAGGATLRPFAFNSVTPRAVRQLAGGTFEMYLAAFQPVDDLGVTGETLWEGALKATASTLGGAWTLDEPVGLLYPLSPENPVSWRPYSAENPSVIVAP